MKKIILILFVLFAMVLNAQTSEFRRNFSKTDGTPLAGYTNYIFLVPQAYTYPTGALALTEDATRSGVYYRTNVPDGEYKIYIDVDKAGAGTPSLYIEHYWIGEKRLSTIADHFDATDSYRLKGTGIQDGAITETKLGSGSVTESKINTGAVTNTKLGGNSVTTEKISPDAVESTDIKDANVTFPKLSQAVVDYIDASGGGTITNNPDDVSLEIKTGSQIGIKTTYLDNYSYPKLSQAQRDSIIALVGDSLGYVVPESYGAIGDGSTDDASAFTAAFTNSNVVLLKANTTYFINSPINVAGKVLITNGAKIKTSYSGSVFNAVGTLATDTANVTVSTLRDYVDKDTDKGNLVIVDDASFLSAGDMILIMCDSTRGGIKIGETATVRYVKADTLFLDHSLYSYYPTNQNPIVLKVNYTTFNTIGWLDVEYVGGTADSMAVYDVQTNYLTLRYCLEPDVKLRGRNAPQSGIVVSSCLRPNIEVDLKNSRIDGLGYGISISDATVDGIFKGRLTGFRHCVTTGAAIDRGISWNNIVSVQAWSGATKSSGTWALDSHISTGSVIWKDCFLYYGGVANDINVVGGGVGFNMGAITDKIINCSVEGFYTGIGMRADKDELIVDGLTLLNMNPAPSGTVFILQGRTLGNLVMKNIYAPNSFVFGASGTTASLTSWTFENIIAERFSNINGSSTTLTIPSSLEINNATFKRDLDFALDSSGVSTGKTALTLSNFGGLDNIKFNNVTAKGFETVFYLVSDTIKSLTLDNCTFEDNYVIVTATSCDINNLILNGNNVWGMSTGVASNNAVVYLPTVTNKIDRVDAFNNKFLSGNYFFSAGNDTGAMILSYKNNIEGSTFANVLWNSVNADSLIKDIDDNGGTVNGNLIVTGNLSGNGVDVDSLSTYVATLRKPIISGYKFTPLITDSLFVYRPNFLTSIDSVWFRTNDSVKVNVVFGADSIFSIAQLVNGSSTFSSFANNLFAKNVPIDIYFKYMGNGVGSLDYQFYLNEVEDPSDNIALNGHCEGTYTDGLNDDFTKFGAGTDTVIATQQVGRTGKAQGFTTLGDGHIDVYTTTGFSATTSYTLSFWMKRVSGSDADSVRVISAGGEYGKSGYSDWFVITDNWQQYAWTLTVTNAGLVSAPMFYFGYLGKTGRTSVFAFDDIYIKEN